MTTKTKDYDSSKNQEIKSKFIGREVFCNVNSLMENQKGWDDCEIYDEIENFYTYPEISSNNGEFYFTGGSEDEKERAVETFKIRLDEFEEEKESKLFEELDTFISELENLESESQEVLEWWAVSNWFAWKLKAEGQPIYDSGSVMVWGRTCSGQAILLDGVISRICEGMEILEGQKYEWDIK